MNVIQIVIIVICIAVILRTVLKFRDGLLSPTRFFVWLIFWAGVIGVVILPWTTDWIAHAVGLARGADLLVYLSIIIIFYGFFIISLKIEKIEHGITKIVRNEALKDIKEKEKSKA